MTCVVISTKSQPNCALSLINDTIFQNDTEIELGQRLGINYVRSLEEEIFVKLNSETNFCVRQSNMGMIAISSVLWDAGMLIVDFLSTLYSTETIQQSSKLQNILFNEWPPFSVNRNLGNVLELGAGKRKIFTFIFD